MTTPKGGTFHPLIETGALTRAGVHAEIGEIAAETKPGRDGTDEHITFWHRDFAISDIVLGQAIHECALATGAGQYLTLWESPGE